MSSVPSPDFVSELSSRSRLRPVCWLNLLCLDAPLVAVVWQWLFASSFHVSCNGAERAALFLTAWLIYLADRFADSLSLGRNTPLSLRQQFCREHWRAWLSGTALIAMTDATLVLRQLDRAIFRAGAITGLVALVYLTINARSRIWRTLPLKEISIGLLFAAGTVLVPAMRALQLEAGGYFSIAAFAIICAQNCICIATWERSLDGAQNRESLATVWPGFAGIIPFSCLAVGVVLSLLAISLESAAALLASLSASALLLAALGSPGRAIDRDVRTALADFALMTPLIPMALATLR